MSLDDLIEKFRGVALDRVERMSVLLVELERTPDVDKGEELAREIHTLKGEAKMMGFSDVNLVAHLTEHFVEAAAGRGYEITPGELEVMLDGVDLLSGLLTKSAGGVSTPIDLAGFVERVIAQRTGEEVAEAEEVEPSPSEPSELSEVSEDAETSEASFSRKVTKSGAFKRPRSSVTDGSLLRIRTSGTTRIDLGRLERLGEYSGEVVLSGRRLNFHLGQVEKFRTGYQELREQMNSVLPQSMSVRSRELSLQLDVLISEFRGQLSHTELWAQQVDAQIRELRHTPLEDALQHYPRAVRDLAASRGKRVRFERDVHGVEVDHEVLTALAEPLLHLVRNAVDHGIESPEERVESGKPGEGVVRLEAHYTGDSIRVVLSDDGSGIDPDFVCSKAIEKGLLSGEQAGALSDEERLALIFEPGFSTRDGVTDVSGRGIGMDIVRRQVGAIGGTVEIESSVGEGTTFVLVVPISSAVSSILSLVLDERVFAVPAKDVERVDFVDFDELESIDGSVYVPRDEGESVPLLDWSRTLGSFTRSIPRGRLTVVFVRRGKRRVAMWVDDIAGEREAITRPLGNFLAGIRLCRGVAITDSGQIVPLLSVNELLSGERLLRTPGVAGTSIRATMELPRARRSPRVLVVEDSEITRALVSGVLRAEGMKVVEAEDGWLGWKKLEQERFDLVLTDVQMPRMTGLDLLEKVRADARFANLPVVILTTLGEAADKERAMSLGASGYLVKLNFQERDLLEMVRRFLH